MSVTASSPVTRSLLVDECSLAYRVTGDDGPPIILIQGVGVHGDGWMPQVESLSPSYRCLTFDNRGIGASQPVGERPLTVERMTQDALALMDALGWESAHVVGHSLGGVIAQDMALTARERVRSLSLLCTVARGSDATRLSGRMLWTGIRTRVGTLRQRRSAFLEIVLAPCERSSIDPDAIAERLAVLFGHDIGVQPPIAMEQLAALGAYDSSPQLRELGGIPTLVVSAVHDPIAPPASGRGLAAGIPGARYVEIEDASHGVPIQQADRINALLLEHLEAA